MQGGLTCFSCLYGIDGVSLTWIDASNRSDGGWSDRNRLPRAAVGSAAVPLGSCHQLEVLFHHCDPADVTWQV